jgi:undecaprenyl-diphosphatase
VTAAILLSDGSPVAVIPLYWLLAAVVATSRVHVKIHHGSDVAGGVLVGLVYGTLVRRLVRL